MNTDIRKVEGTKGDFKVTVAHRPRYVNPDKCTGCGLCAEHCPVEALDEYNLNMSAGPAVGVDYQQAVPRIFTIDKDICLGCGLCFELCKADAVDYEQEESIEVLNVGAVIIAAGSELFDCSQKPEFGWARFPNVVSALEFERILAAGGPYRGLVLRPSDGEEPKSVAFLQCVGSRDTQVGKDYCSSACCMYATKEAVIAKDHVHGLDCTIFYMDIRSFGKDFDKYVERAKEKSGVKYIRSRVSNIEEDPLTHNLILKYETEEGEIVKGEYEMVVLSAGLSSPHEAAKLAEICEIDLDEFGFASHREFTPLSTKRDGIYVIGAFQGPKDIPETVTQSSAAAALASGYLSSERGKEVTIPEPVPLIDVTADGPRIGVFLCHCGINIAGVLDMLALEEFSKTLPNVMYVERNLFTCSQDTQEKMKEVIKEQGINRVVVASCTPRTHEPLFQETCAASGLNRYLFEMANIRDQCSWVHAALPAEATEKAKNLIEMAVHKAGLLKPLERLTFPLTKKALVIGGGIAGMTAALGIAEQGFEVALVEREAELGGHLRHIRYTLSGDDPQELLEETVKKVNSTDNLKLYTSTNIKNIEGYIGNFKTTLDTPKGEEVYEHGIVIVCTGGLEHKPNEYLYGQNEWVLTQSEFENLLADDDKEAAKAKNVVMIQCVGSRNEEHPYCSRFCCTQAVKNALKLKEINPDANIYVLYRDIRTYGMRELAYKEAREKGIIFITYDPENPPEAEERNGKPYVHVLEKMLGERIGIPADYLVLSVATTPQTDTKELGQMLKIGTNAENFYLEAHMKLRPVDFATDGVFMAGLCHFPKFIEESIVQANAAVSRACTVLTLDQIEAPGTISEVNTALCSACGMCEQVCPYSAVEVVEVTRRGVTSRYAEVTGALCKGCGLCAASCRSNAIDIKGFTNAQVAALIDAV